MKVTIFLTALLYVFALSAQHIGYLIPSGGQPGQTVEILIGGQQLSGIKTARVSGRGVTVESVTPVPGIPVISGKQHKFIAGWMRNIVSGKKEIPPKPEDEEELKTWRKHKYFEQVDQLTPLQFHLLARHLFVPRNPLQMSPAINSNIIIKLKIAPDAPPGRRELRLVRNNFMLSNPLPFYVDPLPGVREPYFPVPPQSRARYEFRLPAVLYGQIMPGETDVWHFPARKGDTLIFQVFARALVPFMGDCVPGHFQCFLELRDAGNRLIAFADDHGFNPDPTLCCVIPEDGEYSLHVRDSLYRGRADFIYRIRAWQGVPPELNLKPPVSELPLKKSGELPADGRTSYPVLLQGCICKSGQTDQFIISARKGEKIVGEVFARRLGGRLDSRLSVTGPDGMPVAFNDDFPRFRYGPVLQHTDSYLCFTAPQTGDYVFRISDTAGHGGNEFGYFLRIDTLRPSFNLYVHPSAPAVRVNAAVPVHIQVEPREGFHDDIRLRIKAPGQYSIIGSDTIPAGTRSTVITLTSRGKPHAAVPAELIAEAELAGNDHCPCQNLKIRGNVFYGDEETQAFAYTHLVPSEEWLLSKTWGPYGSQFIALADSRQSRIRIKAGKTALLKLKQRKLPEHSSLEFQLKNAPPGLSLDRIEIGKTAKGWTEISLPIQADEKMKSTRINLPVTVLFSYQTKPNKDGKVFKRKSEFILPVLLFDIREE